MYADRRHAGEVLASHLGNYAGQPNVVVLGLVRGGVPVAARVAAALGAPLDVLVVRKLGVPWAPEVAFGAIGAGGIIVHNEATEATIPADEVGEVVETERDELTRRERLYRGDRPPLDLAGKIAIVVDDGLATGATARAAVQVVHSLGASRVVLAVPVGAPDAVGVLRGLADEVVCPVTPEGFGAVSSFYDSFGQTEDEEVISLLRG